MIKNGGLFLLNTFITWAIRASGSSGVLFPSNRNAKGLLAFIGVEQISPLNAVAIQISSEPDILPAVGDNFHNFALLPPVEGLKSIGGLVLT